MARNRFSRNDRKNLELEIKDSNEQRSRPDPFTYEYRCACGNYFTHARVPRALAKDLRCPECQKGEG